ncbi:restriction endonuclease subunit S [Variovorax sp. KBS0712]|nr:restriction endonuclease subunit S [Variovorax sp. KBS0712]
MASEYVESGIPFLRSLNIEPFGVNKNDLKFVTREFHQRIKKSSLRPGDVAIVRTGKPGTCAVIPDWLKEANCSDLVLVRCGEKLRPRFLCYWVNSIASHHISSHTVGAVQQHFNVGAAKTMLVAVPSLKMQDEVITVLSCLDDRITLLRETNATLEAIAQALFKSWFIDFDPVRAKMAGRAPEGMDEATAALFPDGFEVSDLGLIPRGWCVDSVYSAAKVIYGAPFASAQFNVDGIGKPLIRIRDLRDESPSIYTQEAHPKGYMVQPGDVVVGMDGEFRAYLWGGEECWLNQRVCVFAPQQGFSAAYVRSSIIPMLARVEASETATTVIHLGKNDIDRFKIVIAEKRVREAFGLVADPLYQRIVVSKQLIRTLTDLRDTLLPRLISGRLRLSELQDQVEEAIAA